MRHARARDRCRLFREWVAAGCVRHETRRKYVYTTRIYLIDMFLSVIG